MGDGWGNAPVEAANTWPADTSEKPPNRYVAPKNSAVGDYERTSVEQTSKRDLGSGPPPVSSGTENSWSKGRPPSPYNREQVRYQDDNNNDRKKRSSNGGDWNDNNDWKKRSLNNGDRNSQNQHLEEREDSFNLKKKSYQASNNDNGTELHDARVPSQKGHDDNRNFSRPPMPTAEYDHRRDPRNSRGPYNSHENDSSSRKPSRAASNDKLTNVIGSPKRPSHSVQDEFDEEEEVIHNSFSTRQAEKRLTNDDPEWRNNKPAGNQDSDVRRKLNEDNVQSARHSLESSTPRLRKVSEKELKDAAVQTDPIDLEPIVLLVCSEDLRKKLSALGFGSVSKSPVDVNVGANTSGRSVLDMGFDELNNYEKQKGNVRKDLDEPWRSPSVSRSTHSPGVTNDSHVPGKDNDQEAFNRSNNARNYPTREFDSRQPLNDPVSGRDPSVNSVSKENKPWEDSSNIPKAKDPLRSASVKSLEPWETTDDKPRRSEIRSTSPGNVRRPLEDHDVSPNIVMKARDSSRPPSPEPWRNPPEEPKKPEFWNRSDNTLRVNSSDSRGHSPSHAPRDVRQHETSFPSNVSRRENDPRWEDESRGHVPKKVDPRTASPRDAHKPRDSSSSSRVAQPWVETQKNVVPQELVAKKPTEKADDYAPPPIKSDTWDSGQGASTGSNDWLQQAAMFQKQLSGQPIAEENDKPLKKEGEPWESQRSEEPWVTTTHNDNLDNSDVNDNSTARNRNNKVGSWNKDSSIKEATSDNHWNKPNQNSFNSRVEQKDDFYNSSYDDKGGSYDDGRSSSRACYKCGKPGHISRECPGSSVYPEDSSRINCYQCNKPGHRALDCPDRDGSCFKCGSPGHMAANCPSKTRKLSPFINPEPSGISPEEAWSRLMKADREKDTDEFERWFEEYAKASPDETFQTIERKLRSDKCTGRIIAIKREGIPFTKCLVDLQGNGGKTYVARPVLSDSSHFSRSSGTLADSEEENYQWLADAGFMSDDPSPACFNCRQKGHLTKDCSVPKKENERPPHLECQHCHSLDHQTKHCDNRGGNGDRNERPYGGYNGRNGYGEKDIRSQGGLKCFKCGEEGHISKECPSPRRENTRVDRFSDSNTYANGTYGSDDRKPSYRRGYDNDGRDGGNRGGRDYTDDYSYDKYQNNDNFNKNRYNASRGSNHNDDKNFSRNRGNDDYSYSRDFNDQGRDLGRRGGNNSNNNNRDGDFNSREERDQSRNSGRGTANRGYDDFSRGNKEQSRGENRNNDDFSRGNNEQGRGVNRNNDDFSRGNRVNRNNDDFSRGNREHGRGENRNNDRVYASRDKRDDYDQEFGHKRDNYSPRNGQDRSRDPAPQKWDTRERSTSVNRGNNGGGPTLKKDTWGQKSVIAEESTGGWEQERSKMMASWNQTTPQRNEDNNSWPSEEKKNSFSNNGRFSEDRLPRGNNNEELRGRSSQTKEVSGSANSKPRDGDLNTQVWW